MVIEIVANLKVQIINYARTIILTAYVVYWSWFLATDQEARVRFPVLP
jgi:hypothetical protein